ncbi:MAG: hypothetical protein HZB53_10230 [Chloroflexi bacterium]|nr:hypothetical protein [Chloroflexota bacterium]
MNPPLHLRPMAAGDIIDTAINLYRRRFVTLFGIVAIVNVPLLVMSTLLSALAPLSANQSVNVQLPLLMATSVLSLIIGLLSAIANILQTSALTFAMSELFNGRVVTVRQAYAQIVRHGASLLVGSIVYAVAAGVVAGCSVFLCFVPAIAILPRWMFVYQGIMLEELDGVEALRRSWRLVDGQFWRTFGIALALGLLSYLITVGPSYLAVALALAASGAEWLTLLAGVASGIVAMFFAPVMIGSTTILYYDLRMRKEGYDLLWMANEIAPA